MKKILFAFVMSLCCLSTTNAQKYVPLVSEDYFWSYCDVRKMEVFTYNLYYIQFYFKGDTIINQINYKKLYQNVCSQNITYYVAAMREDNKKTYAVFQGENKEKLIYDFGLNKGDIFYSELTNNLTGKVQEVDSVNVNGGKRKRIIFEYSFDVWVEGIGSLDNHYLPYPLNGILTYDLGRRFNYQKNKGNLVYNTSEWYFNQYDCGQYKKYFDNNPVWTCFAEDFSGRGKSQISLSNDTLIENKTYKKVITNSYSYNPRKLNYIREENGKVYGMGGFWNDAQKEYLLYDFSLKVGDTLYVDMLYGIKIEKYPIITKIDSVTLLNGEKRKQFYTDYAPWGSEFKYIEGIGSLTGLFEPFFPICTCGRNSNLICFTSDDISLYTNPTFCSTDDCCKILSSISQLKQINFTISPNPAKDMLKITLNESIYEPTVAKIINSLGKTVLVQKLESQEQLVSLKNIPAGIYLLQIEKGNQKESVKFIKQ